MGMVGLLTMGLTHQLYVSVSIFFSVLFCILPAQAVHNPQWSNLIQSLTPVSPIATRRRCHVSANFLSSSSWKITFCLLHTFIIQILIMQQIFAYPSSQHLTSMMLNATLKEFCFISKAQPFRALKLIIV